MAMTYTWEVTGLKKRNQVNSEGNTLEGAIVQTYWRCIGTDDTSGETGEFSGATPFTAENVPAAEFKPFSELTEEIVLGWIRNIVDNDPTYWEHISGQIDKQIDQRQVEDAALPWAPVEVEEAPEVVVEPAGEDPEADPTANTAE